MNTKTIAISDAEWEVMKIVWDLPGSTAREIADSAPAARGWNPRTVKTLISRLTKKGALRFEEEGLQYRYFPAIAREEAVREEVRSFMRRVFDGMKQPMLSHFVASSKLSRAEIDELQSLLDAKREELDS